MYVKSEWTSRDKSCKIIKKYHTWEFAKKHPRAERKEVTTEKQKEINQRRRRENLAMLMKDNFPVGSWYLTFTFKELPEREEIPHQIELFMSRMRGWLKRRGKDFKWIRVIENMESGRPHFHLLTTKEAEFDEMQAAMKRLWKNGMVKIIPYGGELTDAMKMSDYFTKQKIAEHGGRISSSRNLKRPEPKKTPITRAQTWNHDMKPPKGYRIIEEYSYEGTTLDGYPIQRIVCERLPEKKTKGRGKP